MAKIIVNVLLFALLALPSLSWATPVNWQFPSTVIFPGLNNSVSGSFTFDADTNSLSNMSLVVTLNGVATPIATAGSMNNYLRIVQSNTLNSPGVFIDRSTLTNAGGTVQIPDMGAGTCSGLILGLCGNVVPSGGRVSNATINGAIATVSPIPAVSQWSLMLLALLLGMLGLARFRRQP